MEKRIVYKTENGGIAVIIPAKNKEPNPNLVPPGTDYKIVLADEIPTDRHFREAWDYDLKINMDKARDIHMTRIRAVRDEKLKALDVETMKGRDVQAEKQALRDLPQTFDLSTATTPDALKSIWPQELEK